MKIRPAEVRVERRRYRIVVGGYERRHAGRAAVQADVQIFRLEGQIPHDRIFEAAACGPAGRCARVTAFETIRHRAEWLVADEREGGVAGSVANARSDLQGRALIDTRGGKAARAE